MVVYFAQFRCEASAFEHFFKSDGLASVGNMWVTIWQISLMWDCSSATFRCREIQNAPKPMSILQGYENISLSWEFLCHGVSLSQVSAIYMYASCTDITQKVHREQVQPGHYKVCPCRLIFFPPYVLNNECQISHKRKCVCWLVGRVQQ